MTAAMGVGAVVGGLLVAAKGKVGLRPLVPAAAAFGIFLALATVAQSLALELVALALAGGASIAFMSTGNSTLQLGAAPNMRGRVMSPVVRRLPGLDPDRRPDRRLGDGDGGRPRGAGRGCGHMFAGGGAGAARRQAWNEAHRARGATEKISAATSDRRGLSARKE